MNYNNYNISYLYIKLARNLVVLHLTCINLDTVYHYTYIIPLVTSVPLSPACKLNLQFPIVLVQEKTYRNNCFDLTMISSKRRHVSGRLFISLSLVNDGFYGKK